MAKEVQGWGGFWRVLGKELKYQKKHRSQASQTVNIQLATLSPQKHDEQEMDIWSRLLGGATTSSANKRDYNSPQQILIRFKKAHDELQHIWRRNTASATVTVPSESVYSCLQKLKTFLWNEVQTPTPHLCARHVSTFHIHTVLAQVSATYNEEGIVQETIEIFKILLDSEEGDFLKDKTFADALTGYVSALSTIALSTDVEARMMELLFAIAAKLRLQPDVLPTWFRPSSKGLETSSDLIQDKGSGGQKEDFPLFYLTVAYIHHDGRVGDFARTGLLYIIESAGQSAPLEQWIIESDLATLMASGLGALYSQLSRKLVLSFDEGKVPAILSFSDYSSTESPADVEKTTSVDFKAHLSTLLSHLVFWQDVLEHCTSVEVKNSLLDHFKFLFLQQLLYPSLVESSDLDGGSSVAVLTYLRCIIESIDHPDLVGIVFQYLLAVPEARPEEVKTSRPTALARRRKSENLISNLAQGQEKPVPELFNLNDLILTSLRSRNQQTIAATLRLVCVLLRNRHQYGFSLMKTRPFEEELAGSRTLDMQDRDLARLFSFCEDLADSDMLGVAYEKQLRDAQSALESHECSSRILVLPSSELETIKPIRYSLLELDDPILAALMNLLKGFMANDVETNLCLTQTISTLASCGSLRLDGWLVGSLQPQHPNVQSSTNGASELGGKNTLGSQTKHDDGEHGTERETHLQIGESAASAKNDVDDEDLSPVFATLDSLLSQIEIFRHEIHNFDIFLSERKHIFKVGDDIDNAVVSDHLLAARRSEEDSALMPPPSKPRPSVPHIGSINQRLLSAETSAQASRASSPRGRPPERTAGSALAGRLSHLRVSPSPSSSSDARTDQPSRSPLRKSSVSSTQSKQRPITPMGPADAFKQKIKVKSLIDGGDPRKNRDFLLASSETSSIRSESTSAENRDTSGYKEIGLSGVLTNVIILQEFVLELAAIVQVRASMFGEVNFS